MSPYTRVRLPNQYQWYNIFIRKHNDHVLVLYYKSVVYDLRVMRYILKNSGFVFLSNPQLITQKSNEDNDRIKEATLEAIANLYNKIE